MKTTEFTCDVDDDPIRQLERERERKRKRPKKAMQDFGGCTQTKISLFFCHSVYIQLVFNGTKSKALRRTICPVIACTKFRPKMRGGNLNAAITT